jgi:phosphate acetyltransferase
MSQHAAQVVRELAGAEGFMSELRRRAASRQARIVFPESGDVRTLAAAIALREMRIVHPVLLGKPAVVRRALAGQGVDPGAIEVIDPQDDPRHSRIADRLYERRRSKHLSQGEARVLARDPLHFGAGLVASGACDGMVAGATHPTAEVIRAGLWHVGLREGVEIVSGAFLMLPPPDHFIGRPLLFADSAVVPTPDEDQLVSIGVASAHTYERLLDRKPRIACLSFSTHGSAAHPSATRMSNVARRLGELGLEADGELQIDAALVESVGQSKAPSSSVAGKADVLLFPDLNAGNIGYKLAERLGGFGAVGPLVQGLQRPVFDLSRGCDALAIVDTASIAALFVKDLR